MQYHNPVSLLVVSSKGWKHHSIETSYSNTGVTTFSFCDTPLLKLSIFFAWQFCCHVPRIFPALWDYYWPWFLKLHTRQLIAIGDPRVCRQMRGQETDLRVRMIGHRASRASSCAKFRTSLSLPIGTAVLAVEKCQKVSTKDKSAFIGTSMSLNSSNKSSRTWTYAHFRIVTSGTSIYFNLVGTRYSLTPLAGFRYNIYRRELVSIFRTYTTV